MVVGGTVLEVVLSQRAIVGCGPPQPWHEYGGLLYVTSICGFMGMPRTELRKHEAIRAVVSQ